MDVKARAERRKAAHKCRNCGRQLAPDDTHVTCPACRERTQKAMHDGLREKCEENRKQRTLQRRMKGVCVRCGRKLTETDGCKLMCGICRQKARFDNRKRAADRVAAGLCVRCGKPNDRAERRKTCSACGMINRQYIRDQAALGIVFRREKHDEG